MSPDLTIVLKSTTDGPLTSPTPELGTVVIWNSAPVLNTSFSRFKTVFAVKVVAPVPTGSPLMTPPELWIALISSKLLSTTEVIEVPTSIPLTTIGSLIWNWPVTSVIVTEVGLPEPAYTANPEEPLYFPSIWDPAVTVICVATVSTL